MVAHPRRPLMLIVCIALTICGSGILGQPATAADRTPTTVRSKVGSSIRTVGSMGQQPQFPLRLGPKEVDFGHGHKMRTNLLLSKSGELRGETKTWTLNDTRGFHGCACASLLDKDGNVIWNSQGVHRYGVDAQKHPTNPSSRTNVWRETVPSDVMGDVRGGLIFQRPCPKKWTDFVASTKAVLDTLKAASAPYVKEYAAANGGAQ